MAGDGRGPLGTSALIVSHEGRDKDAGATCKPRPEVHEECVNRFINATINQEFGHWMPPVNYCKTYVGYVITECMKPGNRFKR